MKTLIWKELRENVKLAALALAIYTLMLLYEYRASQPISRDVFQPLTAAGFLWDTTWFCGIFGAVLGWLQIHNERRPDLWAFLLHRPMARTRILLSKTIAGLGLYVVAAGLPLLGYAIWASVPGHVAAPFEPAMLRPALILFLAGTVAYFAGMLTGLRQARWYGSRALGLGVVVLILLRIGCLPAFWQSLVLLCLAEAALVAAVWAGFGSDGHYEGQPAWGKAALTGILLVGSLVVVFAAAGFLTGLIGRGAISWQRVTYVMGKTGTVFKMTENMDWRVQRRDLVAEPLLGAQTGIVTNQEDFNRLRAWGTAIFVGREPWTSPGTWMGSDCSLFKEWGRSRETIWYYWNRYGRLVGYDLLTRRFVGSLGPNGFARDVAGEGDRFSKPADQHPRRMMASATQAVLVDLEQRTTQSIFTSTGDDPILAVQELGRNRLDLEYYAVVTKRFIHLLTQDGKPLWRTPYEPSFPQYDVIDLSVLEPPGHFGVFILPSTRADPAEKGRLPIRVIWLAEGQGELKSAVLPALPQVAFNPGLGDRLISSLMPPPLVALARLAKGKFYLGDVPPWLPFLSGAIAALVCLPIGWWLGRRYRFSLAAQVGWAVFHLLFGVSGLLAFLSVQEWPAREACPNCKKLRVVDRAQCEHCGVGFASPEKTGTEVFAPLGAKAEPLPAG